MRSNLRWTGSPDASSPPPPIPPSDTLPALGTLRRVPASPDASSCTDKALGIERLLDAPSNRSMPSGGGGDGEPPPTPPAPPAESMTLTFDKDWSNNAPSAASTRSGGGGEGEGEVGSAGSGFGPAIVLNPADCFTDGGGGSGAMMGAREGLAACESRDLLRGFRFSTSQLL